jgi:hypothetical protein
MMSSRQSFSSSFIFFLANVLLVLCLVRSVRADEDPLKLWLACDKADSDARKFREGLDKLAAQRDRCQGPCTDLRKKVEEQEREDDRLGLAHSRACHAAAQTHPYMVNLRLYPEVCPQDYQGSLFFKTLEEAVASGLNLEKCVIYFNPNVEPHRYYTFEWASDMVKYQEVKILKQRCEQFRLCADRTDEYQQCSIYRLEAGTWKGVIYPLCTNGYQLARDPIPPGVEQVQYQLTQLCKKGDKDACAVLTTHGVDPTAPLLQSKHNPTTKDPQQCGTGVCSPAAPKTAAVSPKSESPLHPFFGWVFEPELTRPWEYKPKRRGTLFWVGFRLNFKVLKSGYSGYYDPFASGDLVVGMSGGNAMRINPILEVAFGADLTDVGVSAPRISLQNGFEIKILKWLKGGFGASIKHNFTTIRLISASGQRTIDISPLTAYGVFFRLQLLPLGPRVRLNLDYRTHMIEITASDLLALPPDWSPHELGLTLAAVF